MSVQLYMDHHIHSAITSALRRHEVDVLTAAEDGASRFSDPALLDRATVLGRALVSQDEDLVIEAVRRQRNGGSFAGLIYGAQLSGSFRRTIEELELIAKVYEPEDLANVICYLPL